MLKSSIPELSNPLYKQKILDYLAVLNPYADRGILILNSQSTTVLDYIDGTRTNSDIFKKYQRKTKTDKRKFDKIINILEKYRIIKFRNQTQNNNYPDFPASRKQKEFIRFWISLTNQCNFRCTYCFVDKSPEKMTDKTINLAINKIFETAKKSKFGRIELLLAGGEPLMEYESIKLIKKLAIKKEKEYRIPLSIGIVTNGSLLTEEMCKYFKENNIPIGISIDGLGEFQNSTRIYKNKLGTFKYVITKVALAKKYGILDALLITVSSKNVIHMPVFARYILEKVGTKMVFSFFNDNNYAYKDLAINQQNLIKAFKKVLKLVFSHYRNNHLLYSPMTGKKLNIDYVINEYPYIQRSAICGAGRNYFTILHDGRIKYCPQQNETSGYSVRDTNNDLIKNLKKASDQYYLPDLVNHHDCKVCEWKYICASGCKNERKYNDLKLRNKSTYCAVIRKLIPYHLKLEAERILLNNLLSN